MNVNRLITCVAAIVVVSGLVACPAFGTDFTWQAGSNDVSTAGNWTPAGGPPGGTATQLHNAHFAAAGSTTPTQGDVNYWVKQMFFDAGAQAYTYTGTSGANTYLSIFPASPANGANALVNNSSQTQVLNVTTGKTGIGGLINTGTAAGGALVINTPLVVSDGSSAGGNYLGLAGSNNVYFNVDTNVHPLGDVNGGTWTNSTTSNMYNNVRARFSMVNFSGTAFLGNIGTSYTGSFHMDSTANGALRLTHDNALGAPGTQNDAVYIYGGTTGNATLELQGDISATRGIFWLDGRSGAVADDPHIRNVTGDNTLTVSGDWNTGIRVPITTNTNGAGGVANAGNWNIQSDSGKLTIAGGNIYNTANVATTLQLKGAGDGQIDAPIVVWNSTPSLAIVKSGAGTWTLTNLPTIGPPGTGTSTWTGNVTIDQGTLSLGATGTFENGGPITVNSAGIFKTSDLFAGEYTLGPTQTLKGNGTVLGGIVSNSGSFIAPGTSVGTLTLSGASSNLTLGGGDTLQYELTNNPLGANDKIVVGGGLTLGNAGPINIVVTALNTSLGSGSYRLIDYAGSLTDFGASFTVTGVGGPASRQTFSVDTTTANQVNLNVGGGAASLTWVGGNNSNAWDLVSTVNWSGAPGPAFDNRFYDGDSVTFTDSGSNSPDINLIGTLNPATVTFNNTSAHDYKLIGSGDLNVSGNMVVSGSGKVTLANTGAFSVLGTINLNSGTLAFDRSDADIAVASAINGAGALRKEGSNTVTLSGNNSAYTGAITVASGTLKVDHGNGNALGTAAGGTTVLTGATLDLNGTTFPTEVVTIAGDGVGGLGVLYDSHASGFAVPDQSHVNGVIMSADAKIGVAGDSVMFVDGAGASFQGNGHNLSVALSGTPYSEFDLVGVGDPHVANITVDGGGAMYLGGNSTLGSNAGTLTLMNGSRLGIYGPNNADPTVVSTAAPQTKPIATDAVGGGLESYRGGNTIASQITINGTLSVTQMTYANGTDTFALTGKITGPGGLEIHADTNSTSRFGRVALTSVANDYGGPTNVGGGGGLSGATTGRDRITLSIGDGGTTGKLGTNGNVTINSTGAVLGVLQFNLNKAYSFSDVGVVNLTGSGAVVYAADNGVVTANNAAFYSGNTTIEHGVVILTNSAGLGDTTGTTQLRGGSATRTGQLKLDGAAGSLVVAENISASGFGPVPLIASDGLIANVAGDNEWSGLITLIGGNGSSLITSQAGTLRLSGGVGLGSTTRSVYLGGASNGTVSGAVADSSATTIVGVEKVGAGTWSITSDANTYTGVTVVHAGTMRVAKDTLTLTEGTIALSGMILVKSGATLDMSGRTDQTLALAGTNQILAGTGAITGSVTSAAGATITPSGPAVDATFFGYSANLANGTMSISGALNLAGNDTVMFELSPSTASGNDKIVHSGALNLGATDTNVLIVPGGGALATGAYTVIDGAVSQGGGGGVFQVDPNHNTRYSFTLNNATAGKLIVNVSGSNASLTWAGGVSNNWNVKADANWTGSGDGQFFQGDVVTFNDSSANLNNVTITDVVNPVSVTVSAARDYTFDGAGRITGSGGLVKSGAGTLTIANTGGNDFTGAVTINGGVLKVGAVYALGAEVDGVGGGDAGTTINSGGTLDLNGINAVAAEQVSANGSGAGGVGAIVNNGAAGPVLSYLTLNGDTTVGGSGNWELAALSQFDAFGLGFLHGNAHSLTKVGTNQVDLTKLGNTNLANVNVNEGTLRMSGSTSIGNNVSTVNVAAGATLNVADVTGGFTLGGSSSAQILKGNGTVIGNVTIGSNGAVQPGASVGTLAVAGNATLNGTLSAEISGTNIDLLAVTGDLTLGGGSVLDIQGNLATATTHVIATVTGSLTGTFGNATDATTNGYNVVYQANQIILDELDGDANHDGIVNIFDINLVSSNWSPAGPVAAFAPGNINHDTVVNIFDINQISSNWAHVATNGGPAHAQAVPEPSTLVITLLGLLGIARYVRGHRRK